MTVDYLTGDALTVTRSLPDASVDLAACSPPFLALRDYNGVEGQWGSEGTPAEFLRNLLELAVETRRVLAPHGSLAWELGDTYSGKWASEATPPSTVTRGKTIAERRKTNHQYHNKMRDKVPSFGWPLDKSLTGVPTLFAWSLAYGRNLLDPTQTFAPWRIRNVIVWARNNPPVGALGDKYRPATSYITVACPSARRWFDLDAVRTSYSANSHARTSSGAGRVERTAKTAPDGHRDTLADLNNAGEGAPPLDHWTDEHDNGDLTWLVNSRGSNLAHYAMWPPTLAQRLILSMCPAEVCRQCGEPRRRIVKPTTWRDRDRDRVVNDGGSGTHGNRCAAPQTLGWSDCGHDNYRPGLVLDQFAGTGTTLHVAELHGRDAIGIDLDPTNRHLLERRRAEVRKALAGEQPQIAGQQALL